MSWWTPVQNSSKTSSSSSTLQSKNDSAAVKRHGSAMSNVSAKSPMNRGSMNVASKDVGGLWTAREQTIKEESPGNTTNNGDTPQANATLNHYQTISIQSLRNDWTDPGAGVPAPIQGSASEKRRTSLAESKKVWLLGKLGINTLEARTLDFFEMCVGRYPGMQWTQLTVKEQADLIRQALKPNQYMIDPASPYMKFWDLVILNALTFTSIVTPYEVAFLETELNGLFFMNRIIDLIFIKDMIMQFFLKVQVQEQRGTYWVRDRKTVAKRYLKGWFIIDVFSILPFDIVGLVMNDPAVQKLKVIRIIRLLRLLKLMRVFRASRLVKRWQDRISISFALQGLIKFAIVLVVLAHWMACIWGMVGLLLGTDLECVDGQIGKLDDTLDGRSWITGHDWGPDTPCESINLYFASLHFSVMTITSIGYGDISPSRRDEYILCILCQLGGGMTWAYIIGSICGIIANANPVKIEFENSMDALNAMLSEQGVNKRLRWQLRAFLRERQYHEFLLRARNISTQFSPHLQGELTLDTAIGAAIGKVWYFKNCATAFVVEVAKFLEASQYSAREKLGGVGILSIVERGTVARSGRILVPGNFWGEDMILTSQYLIDETPGISLGFVELLCLSKSILDQIMVNFPEVERQIRKSAVWIAFRIAVRLVASERILQRKLHTPLARGDLKVSKTMDNLNKVFAGLDDLEEESASKDSAQANPKSIAQSKSSQSSGPENQPRRNSLGISAVHLIKHGGLEDHLKTITPVTPPGTPKVPASTNVATSDTINKIELEQFSNRLECLEKGQAALQAGQEAILLELQALNAKRENQAAFRTPSESDYGGLRAGWTAGFPHGAGFPIKNQPYQEASIPSQSSHCTSTSNVAAELQRVQNQLLHEHHMLGLDMRNLENRCKQTPRSANFEMGSALSI